MAFTGNDMQVFVFIGFIYKPVCIVDTAAIGFNMFQKFGFADTL
jgi:hypothetical protein